MNRAVRAARTFATYTTVAGAASFGTFLAYTRHAEFVPFSVQDDPIVASTAYKKFNAFGNDGAHDLCVRRVPLGEIREEYLQGDGKLVEKFCGGIWAEFGYDIQRKYLERKYRGPATATDLWDPPELKGSTYPVGTRVTDHFEVLEHTASSITLRAGDSPRIAGPRDSDGLIELGAKVRQDEGVVEFTFKSVFYKGDGPGQPMPDLIQWLHRLYTKLLVESALKNVRK
ncbi:hypothetical protein MIND_00955500 [Mycena indigotica]|uniref:Uncharacterized protein n=1 Tax=Mycena indigotica TaxID=2126181 RepID=A0A8H6VX19_9AGAR|nr:uncharacterized protein MIND_00955500 [Mycena indigotica]KAF7297224.1 hypothetical protein MIND_00955500 [Mycena indigotica]